MADQTTNFKKEPTKEDRILSLSYISLIRNLLECADYEVGSGPFTLTAFHDGVDGLTIEWIEVKDKSQLISFGSELHNSDAKIYQVR